MSPEINYIQTYLDIQKTNVRYLLKYLHRDMLKQPYVDYD